MANKSQALGKLSSGVSKFAENRYVRVITEGMMGIMPISLVGSFCVIIVQLLGAIPNAPEFVVKLAGLFMVGSTISSNLISLFVVIALGAAMARAFKQDLGASIIISMVSFFIVTPIGAFLKTADAEKATAAIDISYLGSKGMFVAILVSILSIRLFALCIDKKLTIKMPEQVPPFVSKTFAQIVPVTIVVAVFLIVNFIFALTPFGNIHDFIYTSLQTPLQRLGDNVISACVLVFLAELLWFFGIHGSMVTSSLLTAFFATQAYANMEAVAAGGQATFIVNSWFIDTFKGPRALALACILLVYCKSKHMKSVGKIAIVPSLFAITEPMKFGIPMVLNPWLLIPMSLSAVVSILIAYFATVIGFLPVVAVNIGRVIPAPINGFLACGWQGVVVQIIQFVVIVLLYLPFVHKVDSSALSKESATEEKQKVSEAKE